MDSSILNSIAESIAKGNAVAFIGAGTSFSAKDPYTTQMITGLPGTSTLVDEMADKRDYIKKDRKDLFFSQACYLYKKKEGRKSLIQFLKEHLNKDIDPLPCQKLLASLPFEMYISMNFDTLLEKALKQYRKKYKVILKEKDISLLENDVIPIVKPHGCFTDEDTIVAAKDEEEPFNEKFPLIDCFLKAKLASKTLIYIGFSLNDNDFEQVHNQLQKSLGELAPKSYAIFLNPNTFQREYWDDKQVTIIDADAGEFLRKIKERINREDASNLDDTEKSEWFDIPFFASLFTNMNLPTETQVIDAFLDKLISDIQNTTHTLGELITLAEEGRVKVLKKRANFEAFDKAATTIVDSLKKATSEAEAEHSLDVYRDSRIEIANKITKKGAATIQSGDNILLFSQSKRVTQLLLGLPKTAQRTCNLYIGECRPKSKTAFSDAMDTVNDLCNTDFRFNIFPDIILGHLFQKGKINKVIMGAHAVYIDSSKKLVAFVNTAGSLIISELCKQYSIPLYIIAEKDKEKDASILATTDISTTEEVSLRDISSVKELIENWKNKNLKVEVFNVGYDLVYASANTFYINEI